jgi:hypothetical protein
VTASRRSVLKRGLAALGGVVGLGVAGGAAARVGVEGASLVLFAPVFEGPQPAPAKGDVRAERLTLLDRPGGARLGELHVTSVALHGPGPAATDADALIWHSFRLAGGTIMGNGSAGEEGGELAVLGGTGRFAGARGTYEARVEDGGVRFVIRLLGR